MTCPRCAGCVICCDGETLCLNCGWRDLHPGGPPIMVNPNRSWTPDLCGLCLTRKARRGHRLCRTCKGLAIKEGYAKKRNRG